MAAKLTIPKSQQLRFMNMAYMNPSHVMYKPPRYDTRLFEYFNPINKFNATYCQKVEQTDNLIVQFRTNYPDYLLTLRNRLTFAETSYNGYEYQVGEPYVNPDGETMTIYNVPINVSSLNGYYDFIVTGYSPDLPLIPYKSEPFEVRSEHENTILMKFGGNESIADGMRWGEASYVIDYPQYIRIEGQMIDIKFGGDINNYIDSDSELTNLNNYPKSIWTLDFKEIPYYLVEKINLALQHDYFEIDGLQFNSDEEFDPTNFKNQLFATGSIPLRVVEYENYTNDEVLEGDSPIIPVAYRTTGLTDRTTGLTERKINN